MDNPRVTISYIILRRKVAFVTCFSGEYSHWEKGNRKIVPDSVPAEFAQPFIADTEVMGYFMENDPLYFVDYLGVGFTHSLNRFLKDGYLIRHD